MSNRAKYAGGSALLSPAQALRRIAFGDSGFQTFDRATLDSTGQFLLNELMRLDQRQHLPLVATFWQRDIDIRSDVTMGDEQSGFTNSGWAAPGGVNPTGINWASNNATAIPRAQLDIGLTTKPLRPWALEASYSIFDLKNSIALGRPIDAAQVDVIDQKFDMDVDQMVFIGDTGVTATGLYNNTAVSPVNVINGAGGDTEWATKTPQEILNDINTLLNAVWTASAVAIVPEELRLPPLQFGAIASMPVTLAGNESVLQYVARNSISMAANGKPLNILPNKWLTGRGAAGSDRMVAYTRREDLVRYPLVPKMFTPVQYRGIWQSSTYYARLGEVELVYPTTVGYADGI